MSHLLGSETASSWRCRGRISRSGGCPVSRLTTGRVAWVVRRRVLVRSRRVELGCARVSTARQDLERQVDALTAVGIARERIYLDKKSGAARRSYGRDDGHGSSSCAARIFRSMPNPR